MRLQNSKSETKVTLVTYGAVKGTAFKAVRKCFAMNPALAAERPHFTPSSRLSCSLVSRPGEALLCIRAPLYRLRKHSCFVLGHDFSRAVQSPSYEGFSP
jgi:hypothetical protein